MWRTFSPSELLRIAKRADRVERERHEDARRPSVEDRLARLGQQRRRLRDGLRRSQR